MNTRHDRWSRAGRRLLFGTLMGAGVIFGLSQTASAAVTASFSNGTLSVFGDNLANNIQISRNAAGQILVNGGAVRVNGGTATVANTSLIQVFGQGNNDVINFNEASGALPRANLFGGAGNDTLTGGSGGDQLFGQAGNDTLLGKGGFDFLFGGSDADTLTGGDADDQVFGESGDDRMIWNPGDDTDLNEGATGTDTVEVNGGNGAETFTTTANGTRVRFDRTVPAPFSIDIGTSEKLVLNANGGDDQFSATGNLATLIAITVDGGTGADTILGGNGNDLLIGGDNDDFVDGNQGSDTAQLGAGNDVFQWDPGDGSDTVEGQDGTADTMRFNGSAIGEVFDASANGQRLRFTRNIGNIVMDVNDLEILDVNAFGGADSLTVNDLTATDVATVDTDLAATLGGAAGDAAADTIVVNGTNGDDTVAIAGAGTSASVVGLHAQVNIANSEGANDALVVNTVGGKDAVTATALPAGIIKLTVDSGTGKDTILGSQGDDTVIGGDGNDFVLGGRGNDVALLGANDDVFQWNPGDGSDTVEGQAGSDSMSFFGANINENVDVSANGGRVRFFRDVANVTMDLDDVENIDFHALGGADNVVVGDLTGTDLAAVGVDLSGSSGGGDGAADTVTVNGTQVNDSFRAAGNVGGVTVFGLKATVNVLSPEIANDRLTLNGQGGIDTIDASALEADSMQLTINGGLGDDTMLGGAGSDLVVGGDGADSGLLGDGDDTFVWNPGDDNDVVEGQSGADTLAFNGANIAENIDISANGDRGRLFRDIANVTMDFDDVETVAFKALGGADNITVNDLTGTDVVSVTTDLFASGGVNDDGAPDNVIVNATNGDDVVVVAGSGTDAAVVGLNTQVTLTGAFSALDRITINALDGDDVVEASSLTVAPAQLTANGGNGDDILIGGDGDDILNGDAGDDVLIGGPGNDILDGGLGDNVVIQLVAEEPVVSATVADEQWIEDHVEVIDGTTVIEVDGEQKQLPDTDLSQLVADVASEAPAV